MRAGLTLPNRADSLYTDAEIAALDDLAPGALVALTYGESASETQHRDVVRAYCRAHPETRVMLRMYSGTEWSTDPAAWAATCAARLLFWSSGVWPARPEVIPANEGNIESPWVAQWTRQVQWLSAFAQAWRALAKGTFTLHLPALSPNGDWRDGLAAYRVAGLFATFGEVDVHAYGPDAVGVVSDAYEIVGRPVCVTEFNRDDPGPFLTEIAGVASAGCYFLLGGTADQEQYDVLRRPDDYQSLKRWTMASNPTESASVARSKIYAIWSLQVIAEGKDPLDKAAFAANVAALGGDPTDLRPWGFPDQQTLSDQIIAKIKELKALIGQV